MEHFGNILITEELNGPDIHNLTNVITMGIEYHDYFDALKLWFEETVSQIKDLMAAILKQSQEIPNQYMVRARHPAFLQGIQMPVVFEPREGLPTPDPRYLRMHAACARVAHLSGAAEHIMNVLKDIEFIDALAWDGSSANLFDHVMTQRLHGILVA